MDKPLQSREALRSELERLVVQIEPNLPTLGDYQLPEDRDAALREIDQLLSEGLRPHEHGERADLLYLKTRILEDPGKRDKGRRDQAEWAGRECISAAARAFFGSGNHSLWTELHWQRIRALGTQRRWLAVERALSEMIGRLAGSSRRRDRAHDLSAARHLRGLVYQLRGLETDHAGMAHALLTAGLRDLEAASGREESRKATEEARRRVARLRNEPSRDDRSRDDASRDDTSRDEPAPVYPLGLVRFANLPPSTRSLFLDGANLQSHGRFFAQKSPYGILFPLALFFFFALATTLALGNAFGPLSGVGLAATAPTLFMVTCAVRIARDLRAYSQKKKAGAITFGFLIDQEQLAIRTVDAFSDHTYFFGKNSVLLPLQRLRGVSIRRKPTFANSGRRRTVDELVIRYLDGRNELRQIAVPDRFDRPAKAIRDLLLSLSQDLVGTWRDGEAALQFDRSTGTCTRHDGKVLSFTWWEIDGAAIEIVPHPDSADDLQAGLYPFDISAKGKTFELEFLEGFGGTTLRRMEKAVPAAEDLNPTRIALRIAATAPLPELGPLRGA